jgi:hypothetical protein
LINGKREDQKEGRCAILGVKFIKKMEMEPEMLGYKSVNFLLHIDVQCFLKKLMKQKNDLFLSGQARDIRCKPLLRRCFAPPWRGLVKLKTTTRTTQLSSLLTSDLDSTTKFTLTVARGIVLYKAACKTVWVMRGKTPLASGVQHSS